MKWKFKIGDRVTVRNNGSTYDCYESMANIFNIPIWKYHTTPRNGSSHIVKGMRNKGKIDELYWIQDVNSSQGYIIGRDGIEFEFIAQEEMEI